VTTGSHPTWSPDGASLAFADGDSVGVVGANGRGRRMLARGSLPAWAPRGDLIAYDAYDNKAVVDRIVVAAADGSRRRALATSVGEPFDFAWSADGQSIVFASTSLWKVDVAGGKPRLLRGVPGAPEHLSPSVSPDGRRLAWISLSSLDGEQLNDINVGDADGTNARRVSQRRQLVASPLTWSPDGNTLFYAAWPHRID
jgi:Tol biopolymer transport system component